MDSYCVRVVRERFGLCLSLVTRCGFDVVSTTITPLVFFCLFLAFSLSV